MVVLVVGVLEDAEEDKTSRHRGVQHTQEDQSGNHEREGDLLVKRVERAKRRRGYVLVANVGIDNGANNAENDDLKDRASPQGLGEVSVRLVSTAI